MFSTEECVICYDDIAIGKHVGGFKCTKTHYFHPECIFKNLLLTRKPPMCPVCRAEPKVQLNTLSRFNSMIVRVKKETQGLENMKPIYFQDLDYIYSTNKDSFEGFLVTGLYPFTMQDFGHGNVGTTSFSLKNSEYYPLVLYRFVPEKHYSRKVIAYGSLVYFKDKVYRIREEDGSIEGPLSTPRDEYGNLTIISY